MDLGNDRQQIRASTPEEAQRLLERARKRAAGEGKEIKMRRRRTREGSSRRSPLISPCIPMSGGARQQRSRSRSARMSIHLRGDSQQMHRLREWMHNQGLHPQMNRQAPPLVPTHVEAGSWIAEGDEHLVFFMQLRDGVYSLCVLVWHLIFCRPGGIYRAWTVRSRGRQAARLVRKPSKDGLTRASGRSPHGHGRAAHASKRCLTAI